MPQEFNMQEAIRLAIQTEKNVMDFYKRAAEATQNPQGKKVFELLSGEEREHAGHFFHLYQGRDLGTFENSWPGRPTPTRPCSHELAKGHRRAMSATARRWRSPCARSRIWKRTCA